MQINLDDDTVKRLAELKIKELATDYEFLMDEEFPGNNVEEVKISYEEYCRRLNNYDI